MEFYEAAPNIRERQEADFRDYADHMAPHRLTYPYPDSEGCPVCNQDDSIVTAAEDAHMQGWCQRCQCWATDTDRPQPEVD